MYIYTNMFVIKDILYNHNYNVHVQCTCTCNKCTSIHIHVHVYDSVTSFRTIEFTINRDHHFQVPVSAVVTDISIIPSCSTFTLSQHPLSTHNTHLQGSLSLCNPHDIPAHFSWNLHEHADYLMVSNHEGQ